MIPASELLSMQQEVAASLDLIADIQRNQSSTITIGQKTDNWQSILPGGVPVACSMHQPSQTMAAVYADLIGTDQAAVFTFGYGQDIQRSDHIVLAGKTWTVQAPLFPLSNQVANQVLATRIA